MSLFSLRSVVLRGNSSKATAIICTYTIAIVPKPVALMAEVIYDVVNKSGGALTTLAGEWRSSRWIARAA